MNPLSSSREELTSPVPSSVKEPMDFLHGMSSPSVTPEPVEVFADSS
jgi:hypothetical protein